MGAFQDEEGQLVVFGDGYQKTFRPQVAANYANLIARIEAGEIDRDYLERFGYRESRFIEDVWRVVRGEELWAR